MKEIARLIEGYKVLFAIDSVEALQKVEAGTLLACDASLYLPDGGGTAKLDCIVQVDSHEMPAPEKRGVQHDYDMCCSFVEMTQSEYDARNDSHLENEGEELEYDKTYDDFGIYVNDTSNPFWYAVEKITE